MGDVYDFDIIYHFLGTTTHLYFYLLSDLNVAGSHETKWERKGGGEATKDDDAVAVRNILLMLVI